MSDAGAAPVVYKFGGSSVADAQRIRHVAGVVAAGPERLVVVVSALGGVTDLLVELLDGGDHRSHGKEGLEEIRSRHLQVVQDLELGGAAAAVRASVEARLSQLERDVAAVPGSADVPEAGGENAARRRDAVLAAGEDLSVLVLSAAVRAAGRDAAVVDAREVVRTDACFGAAVPDGAALPPLAARHLVPVLDRGEVAVVQGFIGTAADGSTTTLGRGGGDFTAALLGGALGAEAVHVWTDVAGILSGDPREVDNPQLLDVIGFEEAVELAWSGARVIHPVAAKWAVSRGVAVRIRSTFHPDEPGTLIRNDVRNAAAIAAVTAKPAVTLIKVRSHPSALPYGFLARVFEVLARYRLEVDLVATSHSSTSFTIDGGAGLEEVEAELEAFADVEVRTGLTTVTVVGRGMLAEPGMDALVFWAVEKTPVHLISQASDVSLSFVVDADDAPALVRRLHVALIELGEDPARRTA
ncbi:MAG: aspartate kinase [Gemmatimonadetes bacterium]|nr:aspartate kinase [Gemmatimonadota bacterium]